jgi:hypothetical protein
MTNEKLEDASLWYTGAAAAAGQVGVLSRRSAAIASPGESRAIRRICRSRDQNLAAHDHGNSFSGSEATHWASARRNPQISA